MPRLQDPLQGEAVNVGRNCFRLLQIQKALADASKALDAQLTAAAADAGTSATPLLDGLICTRVQLA